MRVLRTLVLVFLLAVLPGKATVLARPPQYKNPPRTAQHKRKLPCSQDKSVMRATPLSSVPRTVTRSHTVPVRVCPLVIRVVGPL